MNILLWLVGSKVGRLVGIALVVILILFSMILYIQNTERLKYKVDHLEGYKETRERIDDSFIPDSVDSAVDWLRKRLDDLR